MRYGCRKCGTPLPAVQAGEVLRIRCSKHTCQFVNVIPADPNLAPWEAHGETRLLVVDDPQGAVLLAPPAAKRHSYKLTIALGGSLVLLTTLAFPTVRHAIIFRAAVHEIQHTGDAVTAQRWCERLSELGPSAGAAAPMVWNLHFQKFAGGKVLKETFINNVLDSIAPGYVSAHIPVVTQQTSVKQLAEALQFPESGIRIHAAELLGNKGSDARSAVGALTDIASKPLDPASPAAIDALGRIGPDARTAVPELIKLLSISGVSRMAAAKALVRIAPQDPRVVTALDSAGIPLPSGRSGIGN